MLEHSYQEIDIFGNSISSIFDEDLRQGKNDFDQNLTICLIIKGYHRISSVIKEISIVILRNGILEILY